MKNTIKLILLMLTTLLIVSACTTTQIASFKEDAEAIERAEAFPKETISSKFYYIDTNEPYDPGKEHTGALPDSVKDIDFYVEMGSKDAGEYLRAFKIVMDKWTCVIPAGDAQFLKYYIESQLKCEDHEDVFDGNGAPLKDKEFHSGDRFWAEGLVVKATSDPSKVDEATMSINRVRIDGDFYVVVGFYALRHYNIISPYRNLGFLCLTSKKAKKLVKILTEIDEHYKKGE